MQDLGYGLTREMVAQVVADYLATIRRPNPFQKGVPGPDWWVLFLKRWPQLSERKPEHLSRKQAEGVTCPIVDAWIDTVEKAIEKYGLDQYGGDELAKSLECGRNWTMPGCHIKDGPSTEGCKSGV